MALPASVADFKLQFDRNFAFGTGLDSVRDSDIGNAMNEAAALFNASLWSTADGKIAFLYASAHFVAVNIQAAGGLNPVVSDQGVNNRGAGAVMSKSVGAVSVTYTEPPERIKRSPHLLPFWETEYGKKYLMLLGPKLIGNVGVVSGPSDIGGVNEGIPAVPDAG